MRILRTAAELATLAKLRAKAELVLVPTMGALHAGHLDLVRQAARRGPTVVSIFVNPTQFGPGEDFAAYPRDLDADYALLEPLQVAAVFAPAAEVMYPREGGVMLQPGPRARGLCGARRPGHFAGVLTVVAKLLNLVRPDLAIFGRKDAQQVLVIAELVADMCYPVRLIDAATVREEDGLALSSRNRYLDAEQRERAACLWQALATARALLNAGERSVAELVAAMRATMSPVDELEYAEVRQVPDLGRIQQASGRILLAVAARVGPARLIDNLVLEVAPSAVTECSLLGDLTAG